MNCLVLVCLFLLSNAYSIESDPKECLRVARENTENEEETTTTDYTSTTLSPESEELQEMIRNEKQLNSESAAVLISKLLKQKTEPRKPFNTNGSSASGSQKSYMCSKLECPEDDKLVPVCACNFITGNVVSFKNKCDSQKHNCRFDTNFKVILDEICPWEFASRRSNAEFVFDYRGPKYFN